MKRILTLSGLLLAGLLLGAPPAGAGCLFFNKDTSNPTNLETGVHPQSGRKGLLMTFQYFNGTCAAPGAENPAAGYPLNLATGSVTLHIPTVGNPVCPQGINPAPGACVIRVVDGEDADGQQDTVEILYNGNFPASQTVTVDITGVRANNLDPQENPTENLGFTTGIQTPRDLAAIELVFDNSGSMGWPAVPAGATLRMAALQSASQVFFGLLNDHAMVGDQLGAVSFSSTASVFDPTVGGTNLEPAANSTQVGLIQGFINGLMPTTATSIGAGLTAANASGFTLDPAPPPCANSAVRPCKFVLLFSDGEENTPPLTTVPADLQVGGAAYGAGIRVCPITAGRMAAPGFTLQQQIATARCNGNNAKIRDDQQTFVDSDLQTHFAQALIDVITGDKLEIVRDTTAALAPAGTAVEPFLANPGDIALSIVLAWQGGSAASELRVLPFQLEAPDGTLIDLTGRVRLGRRMLFSTLRLPVRQGGAAIPTPGEWKIRVGGPNVPPLTYHLIVLLDNAALASEFSAAVNDPGTGEPIPVRVRLGEGGSPVAGATVTATVIGPREGLGDVLSERTDRNPVPSPDAGLNAAANGKLLALLSDPSFAGRLADRGLPTVTLVDDGSAASGDAAAGDGIYSGVFRDTAEEGHYHFVFGVRGNAPANGEYQRTYRLSVFARPKPDPARTVFEVVSVTPGEAGSTVVLRARPQDALGNLIGPGYLGSLVINVAGGTVVNPLRDNLDGSYQVSYSIPSGSNPRATLDVLGQTVIDRPVSGLPGGGSLGPAGGAGGWRLSLHFGATDPHGSLAAAAGRNASFGVDLERVINPSLSVEAYLGRDRFDSKTGGDDPRFDLLSLRGRWTFGSGTVRPSLFAGAGAYRDEDDDTSFGLEAGAALDWWLSSSWALEAGYTYRNVDGRDFEYGVYQAGVRIAL